jgi:Fur family ferric uptake transcriptional regulator
MSEREIIHQYGLKITPLRKRIIEILLQNGRQPVSEAELHHQLGEGFDRVTCYRTIKRFLDLRIIHQIMLNKQEICYALNPDLYDNKLSTMHAHFICQKCNHVYCIPIEIFDKYKIPDGFISENIEITISGTCNDCNIIACEEEGGT